MPLSLTIIAALSPDARTDPYMSDIRYARDGRWVLEGFAASRLPPSRSCYSTLMQAMWYGSENGLISLVWSWVILSYQVEIGS